jgi:CDP-diacylglycerol--glycerol-3-phosphate 3-phosphatidyltransferase
MNLKQQIPNILSILRIFLSLSILLVNSNPIAIVVVMLLSGLTDVLDGYIARKFGYKSLLGARLDSLGDYVFFLVLVLYFSIWHMGLIKANVLLLSIVIAIRVGSLIVSWIKNKQVYSLHTIANKVTGIVVFIGVTITIIVEKQIVIAIVLIVSMLSAIEELLIMLLKAKPDINIKSIFRIRGNA